MDSARLSDLVVSVLVGGFLLGVIWAAIYSRWQQKKEKKGSEE